MTRVVLSIAFAFVVGFASAAGAQTDPADAAYRSKDYAAAASAYRTVVAAAPENATAWYRLGVSLAALGDDGEAARSFEIALARGFDASSVHYRLAQLAVR
ncbi:MAG: tetratricopeptide repeat protein, partial [Candidatus Eremiobacteraeota bacterium]|nr:tetratricopeptide repeat protein [Candidatus Eremiobacteraeota bacterium]